MSSGRGTAAALCTAGNLSLHHDPRGAELQRTSRRAPTCPGGVDLTASAGPLGDTALVNRVVLLRRGEGAVEARECSDDGPVEVSRLPAEELAGFVRKRELSPVRWVWDDTTRL